MSFGKGTKIEIPEDFEQTVNDSIKITVPAGIYKISGDYTRVKTKDDYELRKLDNKDEWFMIDSWSLSDKLDEGWKIVE